MTRGKKAKAGRSLLDLLGALRVGDPVEWGGIQVFPLAGDDENGHEPDYALVDDLLEAGQAEISEVRESGEVPFLKLRNDADVDALILDGLELKGAKQNRMVNVTIIGGRKSETEIPVSCVEAGRWSYRSRHFSSAQRTVASKLRRRKAAWVATRLAWDQCDFRGDQGAVWSEIDGYLRDAQVASPTSALDDAFEARGNSVESYVDALGKIDACGAIVAVKGEIVALDLVDHRETFRKLWQVLLRGYAMDAALGRETSRSVEKSAVEEWLRTLPSRARLEARSAPGVGAYYSVLGKGVSGGITCRDGKLVHAAVFAASPQ